MPFPIFCFFALCNLLLSQNLDVVAYYYNSSETENVTGDMFVDMFGQQENRFYCPMEYYTFCE